MLYVRFLSSLSPPLDTFATVSKVYRPSQTPHPAMSSRDSRGLYGVTPFSPAPAPLREGKQEGRSGSYRRPHPWLRELSWVTLDPQALKPHLMRAGRAPGRGGLQSLEACWDYPRLAQQAARSAKKSLAPPGPRAPPPFPAHSPPEREEHTRGGGSVGRRASPVPHVRPDGHASRRAALLFVLSRRSACFIKRTHLTHPAESYKRGGCLGRLAWSGPPPLLALWPPCIPPQKKTATARRLP